MEETKKVIAAWENWSKQFLSAPIEPMSVETSALLATCLLTSDPDFPGDKVRNSFTYRVAEKRAPIVGLKLDTRALTFLALTLDTPGLILMYLSACKYAVRLRSRDVPCTPSSSDVLTLQDLCEIFPYGFVAKDQLSGLWLDQKCHTLGFKGDNMLDLMLWPDMVIPE